MVRAKFYVRGIESFSSSPARTIKMSPVVTGSEENKAFWTATPSGDLTMYIQNEPAAKFFELGKEYYIDFTRCGE